MLTKKKMICSPAHLRALPEVLCCGDIGSLSLWPKSCRKMERPCRCEFWTKISCFFVTIKDAQVYWDYTVLIVAPI